MPDDTDKAQPKVTINSAEPTAAQALLVRAKEVATTTDARGRVLTLRKPSMMQQINFNKVPSAENGMKPAYMMMIAPLMYLQAIDDVPTPIPTTDNEIQARVEHLGDDGFEALIKCMAENYGDKTVQEERDAVKE